MSPKLNSIQKKNNQIPADILHPIRKANENLKNIINLSYYLADQVLKWLPGDLSFSQEEGFGQIGVQQLHADSEVRFVEVVRDVPSDFAILSSLLDDGVEKS